MSNGDEQEVSADEIREIGEAQPAIPLNQSECKPTTSQLEQIVPLVQSKGHLQVSPSALGHEERKIKIEESNEKYQQCQLKRLKKDHRTAL